MYKSYKIIENLLYLLPATREKKAAISANVTYIICILFSSASKNRFIFWGLAKIKGK
jgi:hypothetical protein